MASKKYSKEVKEEKRDVRIGDLEKILPVIERIDEYLSRKSYASAIFLSENLPSVYNSRGIEQYVREHVEKGLQYRKY